MCSRRGSRVGTERWAASRILLLPCCRGQRRNVTRPRPSGYGTEPLGSTANGDQLRCAAIVFNPQNNDFARFWHSQRYSVNTNNWGTKSRKHFTEFQSVVNTGTCDAVITACNCPQLFFKGKNQRGTKYLPQVFVFVLFSEIFGGWVEPCHHHNTS